MNLLNKFEKLSEKNKLYIIFAWILILVALYIIKYFALEKGENKKVNQNTYNTYSEELYVNENSGSKVDENDFVNPVENFCEYCENEEYEKAYDMLSNKNKQAEYSDLKKFEEYIKSIFVDDSIYNVKTDNFFESKYTIEIYDNVLSTGTWKQNNLKEINTQVVTENNVDKIEIL